MDAKTAELIVSNNLGPIMKRIRKNVEKDRMSIGETFSYQDEASLYLNQRQIKALEQLGYVVKFKYYNDEQFEDEFDVADVYVEWRPK